MSTSRKGPQPDAAPTRVLTSSFTEPLLDNAGLTANKFIGGAGLAFCNHYGFTLAPQHLFLLIVQAIAAHVSKNSEELRSEFVAHAGKKDLEVLTSAWDPTQAEWVDIVAGFDAQIQKNTVQGTHGLFSTIKQFSTTTSAEATAGQVALMDTCQAYFDYRLYSMCGIPQFNLEGSLEDWALLRARSEEIVASKTLSALSSYWLPALLPVLDRLVDMKRKGNSGITPADRAFLDSFFKKGSIHGSGGYTYVSGWINVFFPATYLGDINRFCQPYTEGGLFLSKAAGEVEEDLQRKKQEQRAAGKHFGVVDGTEGADQQLFPSGCSSAPVEQTNLATGEKRNLKLFSGFVGSSMVPGPPGCETQFVRPEVAWWVVQS